MKLIRNAKRNLEFYLGNLFVDKEGEDTLAKTSLIYSKTNGNAGVSIGGLASEVNGNAGVNMGLFSEVNGNAGTNMGLFSGVNGNAGVSMGGLASVVNGNAGVSIGGLFSEVNGNAGVSIGGIYARSKSEDYTIGEICPRITKYLPKCLRDIALPAVKFGLLTSTERARNSLVCGPIFGCALFNHIVDHGEDYLALGLVNRITNYETGKTRYTFLTSNRVSIDGIFKHREDGDKI